MSTFNYAKYDTVFVHIVAAVLRQGKASAIDGEGCKYRHGDLRCAVGHLIPDEQYDSSFEGKRFDAIRSRVPAFDVMSLGISEMVAMLQFAHDTAYSRQKMENGDDTRFVYWFTLSAHRIANMYGLFEPWRSLKCQDLV